MFREMRRKKQVLTTEESVSILHNGTTGVLGLIGDDGYPYTVPINYLYLDNKIYFHCAKSGHKIDAINSSPKASFTVIGRDEVIAEEYTDYFKSVIAFGKIRVMADGDAKRKAIEAFTQKYSIEYMDEGIRTIDKHWDILCMLEFAIEHLSGKQAIELAVKSKD